ncbi:MAG: hypothetical protein HQM11_18990 [SAR324 cluster bacterium]|nr:hypothetical protein [SAR324 cluster bacterium]
MDESQEKKTLKLSLPFPVWQRLSLYSNRLGLSKEETIEKILVRYLPDVTGNLSRTMESLSDGEIEILKKSFYLVIFLVSYADAHISLQEKMSIQRGLNKLRELFGDRFIKLMVLAPMEQKELFQQIKRGTSEDIILHLLSLKRLLDKLPPALVTEYKKALLEISIDVASASKTSLLSSERISKEEKTMIFTIIFILNIDITPVASIFDDEWVELQRIHTWKTNPTAS